MTRKKSLIAYVITALTLMLTLFLGMNTVKASEIMLNGTKASDAVITTEDGIDVTGKTDLNKWTSYKVTYNWSVSNEIKIKKGDTAAFEVPENVNPSIKNIYFDVKDSKGNIVGNFNLPKDSHIGVLTFNDYFEKNNLENIHGTLSFTANGTEKNASTDWNINKAGWLDSEGKPTWTIVYNPKLLSLSNVKITDTIKGEQTLDLNSIQVWFGSLDENGQFNATKKVENPIEEGIITVKDNVMTLSLEKLDSAIQIVYTTTPTTDNILNLTNTAIGSSNELGTNEVSATINVNGDGSASGNNKPECKPEKPNKPHKPECKPEKPNKPHKPECKPEKPNKPHKPECKPEKPNKPHKPECKC